MSKIFAVARLNYESAKSAFPAGGEFTVTSYQQHLQLLRFNALVTDGSVRFVTDSVTLAIFQKACVRNDGNAMGSDW